MIKDTANLAFHPVANIFPLMEGKPFEDICDSIQQNGLLEPIWLYQMQIIDGRNRYRACIETGTAPRFRTYEGDEGDLVAFVVALNLHRRHLSESQRAMVAEKIANLGEGRPRETSQICPVTQTQAASMLNVSVGSVKSAKAVRTQGTPELVKAVERGDMAVSLAASVVALPEDDQELVTALVEEPEKMRELARDLVHNHRAQGTGENEWYTPEEYIETVREFLGGIDLDPASSEVAQKVVQAGRFFTVQDNGLEKAWDARGVWLNPPYAQPAIAQFITKAVGEFNAGNFEEGVVLTHNYTDTAWFHLAATNCSAICFTRGRIGFLSPEGKKAAPTQGQAFFYFGDRIDAFREAFEKTGFVVVAA